MSRWVVTIAGIALSATASARPNVECRSAETQAECHARLKCKADEEVAQCQARLRAQNNAGGSDDRRGDDRGRRGDDGYRDDGGDRGRRGNGRADNRRSRRHRGGGSRGRSGGRNRGSHDFEANKTFGLGLELGEPTGLVGKYFLSDSRALDFGVGYIYHPYYFGDGFHVYGDHLWHPTSLVSTPTLELPFYVGVGLRLWDFEYCEQVGNVLVCDRGSALGVRVPVGLSFDFNNTPIDIFVQLVPVIDFAFGDYYDRFRDRNHLAIDGSFGIRFWF